MGVVMILAVRIEQVRRGGGEKGAAGSLGRHVLRDADRLATRLLALNLGLRGQRVRVGWPSPPGSQLLDGVHDRIVVEEPAIQAGISTSPADVDPPHLHPRTSESMIL